MIIDAHTHIFPEVRGMNRAGPTRGVGLGRMMLGSEPFQLMPPLSEKMEHTPEMLVAHMDWVGIDRAVLLQGPWYGECNDYALEAVGKYPGRFAAQAYLDPWSAGWEKMLESVCARPEWSGVKIELAEVSGLGGIHPGIRLDDPHCDTLWKDLERSGKVLTIDLGAPGHASYQTDAVRRIAMEHPLLTIVICHLAQPRKEMAKDADLANAYKDQLQLGLLDNVYFDTAALPAYCADEEFPWPSHVEWIRAAIRTVGCGKILWGTDVPGLFSLATYRQLLSSMKLALEDLTSEDQNRILGGNARSLYFRDEA